MLLNVEKSKICRLSASLRMVGEYRPNDKMLDPSILKPQTTNKMSLLIGFIFQSIENILGKGDNADYNC